MCRYYIKLHYEDIEYNIIFNIFKCTLLSKMIIQMYTIVLLIGVQIIRRFVIEIK